MLECSCRDLWSFVDKSISVIRHWCWVWRSGVQIISTVFRGVEVSSLCRTLKLFHTNFDEPCLHGARSVHRGIVRLGLGPVGWRLKAVWLNINLVFLFDRYWRRRLGLQVDYAGHDGYRFCYTHRGKPGSRPSILMLHGFSAHKDMWLGVVKVWASSPTTLTRLFVINSIV